MYFNCFQKIKISRLEIFIWNFSFYFSQPNATAGASSSWIHKRNFSARGTRPTAAASATSDQPSNQETRNKFALGSYDPLARNPMYCGAESTLLWELSQLSRHYHPSVALFAQNLIDGIQIKYSGNLLPIQLFFIMSMYFIFWGVEGFWASLKGRISRLPEQPCWLYALIALKQHSPLPRKYYPSRNWSNCRCLTSVFVTELAFPSWHQPLTNVIWCFYLAVPITWV